MALLLSALPGCGSDDAEGTPAGSCTIVDLGDGNSAIRCADGTELVVQNGKDGKDGEDGKGSEASCTLTDKGDGTFELACGETSVTLGDDCENGFRADLRVGDFEDNDGPVILNTASSGGDFSLMLFEMTNCTWVRGDVIVENYADDELPSALSRIEKVSGEFLFIDNPALQSISLPHLREVGGRVKFAENASLTEIGDFPALVSAEQFLVYGHPELVKIGNLPKLVEISTLDFYSNDKLETIGSFDELTTITDFVYWDYNPALEDMGQYPKLAKVKEMNIRDNDSLEAVTSFDALSTIEAILEVMNNAALTSIEGFSALATAGTVRIQNNPKLAQCHVEDLLDGVTAESVDTSGNDEAATCP